MPTAKIIPFSEACSLQYKERMARGFQEGKEAARREYLEKEKKTHTHRSLVHRRWFWRGLACTATCVALFVSRIIPQLDHVFPFVIGGAAVFAAMHLKKWASNHFMLFESTYSED